MRDNHGGTPRVSTGCHLGLRLLVREAKTRMARRVAPTSKPGWQPRAHQEVALRLSFRHLSRSALSIGPAVLLPAASQVRADPPADAAKSSGGGRFGVAASIQYAFKGSDNSVLPVISLGNRDDLAQSPSRRLVSLHY